MGLSKCPILLGLLFVLLIGAVTVWSCAPPPISLEGFDFEHSCGSPNGKIPEGAKCYSPDGTKYARMTSGVPVLYDTHKEPVLLTPLVRESDSDAKAFCFSPDSSKIAILYHYTNQKHVVYLVNIDTLKRLALQALNVKVRIDGENIAIEGAIPLGKDAIASTLL